jgi:hypothetical protein
VKRPDGRWQIGEMRLRVPHMSVEDARWLGREVARRLAELPGPPKTRDQLTVRVAAPPAGVPREQVAARIVSSIVEGWK